MTLLGIVPVYSVSLMQTLRIIDPYAPTPLYHVLNYAVFGIGLWILLELGCLKGTEGPNRYGPDPLRRPTRGFRPPVGPKVRARHISLSQGGPSALQESRLAGSPAAKGGGTMNLDFQYLFTSFEGRINRAKYWAGTIILAIISIVLGFILGAIFGPSTFGIILVVLITLALFYPGYAVAAKRFQDRDKPGSTALYGLVPVLIASLLQAFGLTGTPQEPNALGWICTLVTLGVGLWFLIDLGILKGTPGPNRYGGDPLAAVR
jgi:uncharacterized membrane protein YhaH (DUF805 family)